MYAHRVQESHVCSSVQCVNVCDVRFGLFLALEVQSEHLRVSSLLQQQQLYTTPH